MAMLASGRAMKGRLWNEAKALAGLAESYARLGERARGGGQTIETLDLAEVGSLDFEPPDLETFACQDGLANISVSDRAKKFVFSVHDKSDLQISGRNRFNCLTKCHRTRYERISPTRH